MGYAVLVPDLFYRAGPYGPFDAQTGFADESSRHGDPLDDGRHDAGDDAGRQRRVPRCAVGRGVMGPVGTVGYCMGGPRALNAAAAHPGRIVAAASFHGGNLAGDAADSPHRNAADIKARVYVGSAGVDKSFPPEQSAKLAEALRVAEVDYIIENYVGMAHGWCVPDHSVFDEKGAERHFARLETCFAETLES